jgi:hypothetical protein
MSNKSSGLRVTLLLVILGLVALTPAFAGSAVIGSVAGSMNATVGGLALRPNTTLFSGDSLQVKDGVAIVAVGKTSRMIFGRDTVASFLRDTNEVTVLLGQGNVSLFHPDDSMALRVKAGDVSVTPEAGFKTLGEIAMLNGSLLITAKEGTLLVGIGDQTIRVAKGKTLTVPSRSSRAPQGAGAAPKAGPKVSGSTALQVTSVGLSGASLITSAVAMSRAGDAKTAADSASTEAASALSAAQAAASAAASAAAGVSNLCNALSPTFPPGYTCP